MATSRLFLVGMMASGKTTVGRLVAEALGWRYLDSDDQVRTNTGRTVTEIFQTQGREALHLEEARALREAAGHPGPVVVSVAGGSVLDAENRELLRRSGFVVWLRAQPGVLADRAASSAKPLPEDDVLDAVATLTRERSRFYEEVADLAVDVDEVGAEEAARRIIQALEGL